MESKQRWGRAVAGATAGLAAVIAFWLVARRFSPPPETLRTEPQAPLLAVEPRSDFGADAGVTDTSSAPRRGAATIVAQFSWGSGPESLGRRRQAEAKPEGPMSFALARDGTLIVLDQVNGRIVRVSPEGAIKDALPLSLQAAQDLAVGPDGTMVVLDRGADQAVAVLGPDGKVRGELPVQGTGIDSSEQVTGVGVFGSEVYLERSHGSWIRIGDLQGRPDATRPTLPGKPSRDGRFQLLASVVDGRAGRFSVSALEAATGANLFTRELRTGATFDSIHLLDSDRAGNLYLAVSGPAGPAPAVAPSGDDRQGSRQMKLFCLNASDGSPLGFIDLPASDFSGTTFRELATYEQGGVVHAQRTEDGMAFLRYDCR